MGKAGVSNFGVRVQGTKSYGRLATPPTRPFFDYQGCGTDPARAPWR